MKDQHNIISKTDQLRDVATSDAEQWLRVEAVGVLLAMQDPGAVDILRDALRNPQYVSTGRDWAQLTEYAADILGQEQLAAEVVDLAKDNPERAETLLTTHRTFRTAPQARIALAKAVIGNEKKDETVVTILGLLDQLDMTEEQKIEYIRSHRDRLPDTSVALQALERIGGDSAFDAALTILKDDTTMRFNQKIGLISGFAHHDVSSARILKVLTDMADEPGRTEPQLQQLFGQMERLVSQASTDADAELTGKYLQTLTTLSEHENPTARSLAVLYLCGGVTSDLFDAAALKPVLLRLQKDDQEIVLGTTIEQIKKTLRRLESAGTGDLAGTLVETIYSRPADDPWSDAVTQGGLDILSAGIRADVFEPAAVLEAIAAGTKKHPGHVANGQIWSWLITLSARKQQLGDALYDLAAFAGQLSDDDAVTAEQVETVFQQRISNLISPPYAHSVEAIIAFAEPMVMSDNPKFTGKWAVWSLRIILGDNIGQFKDPVDNDIYAEFVKKVADKGNPGLRLIAINGLNHFYYSLYNNRQRIGAAFFKRQIAGQPAKIMPTAVHNNPGQPVKPQWLLQSVPDGVLLASRVKKGWFCEISRLPESRDVAFLDKEGNVIAVTTTIDPAVQNRRGQLIYDDPKALHALLLPKGQFTVSVGDAIGLDPAFLQTLLLGSLR